MKTKKFLVGLVSLVMVLTLVACNDEPTKEVDKKAPADETVILSDATSVDFEDGMFGFMGVDASAGNADESEISVVDFNGSKALKVSVEEKSPYIILDVQGLLGEKVSDLRKVTMDMGTEFSDGKFYACSGMIYSYSGTELTESKDEWSVYLESSNPKSISAELSSESEYFVANAGNYMVISKEVDTGMDTGATPADLYIDNIRFYDQDGNIMTADTSAVYTAPVAQDVWTGLTPIGNETEIGGFAVSADEWAQAGIVTTNDSGTFDPTVLKPGMVLTIYYSSEGEKEENMWFVGVSNGNPNGDWIRIAGSESPIVAAYNADKTMCQITYEQLVEALGEDFTTTLVGLQCESDGKWETYKVTYGTKKVPLYGVANETEIEGFVASADGWAQAGISTTNDGGTFDPAFIKPGTVLTINYKTEGAAAENMWLVGVSNGNPNGDWIRICGDQADGAAIYNDDFTKCQITYDQIVKALGEDFTTTLTALQCESDGKWEVYSVTYGDMIKPYEEAKNQVEIESFAVNADGWAQAGISTTNDGGTFDASTIVPGSIITISYKTEGTAAQNMWLVGVSNGNPNGDWIRICGDQADGVAIYNNDFTKCQITYDQIVEALGEDFATTLTALQCESDGKWEVYSVTIGTVE